MSPNHSEKLLIYTRADFVWQNGLEYALQGVSLASRNGINLHYLLEGTGPELESLGFSNHDLGLEDICTLFHRKSRHLPAPQQDIFLIPAVKPGYFVPPPGKIICLSSQPQG